MNLIPQALQKYCCITDGFGDIAKVDVDWLPGLPVKMSRDAGDVRSSLGDFVKICFGDIINDEVGDIPDAAEPADAALCGLGLERISGGTVTVTDVRRDAQ